MSDNEDSKSDAESTVDIANANTVLVKNVDLKATKNPKELFEVLGLSKSDIESHRFRCLPVHPKFNWNPRVGLSKGEVDAGEPCQCYIVCKSEAIVQRTLAKNTALYNGKHLFVTVANSSHQTIPFDRRRSVFVGRLPEKWTEDHVYELFSQIGKVRNVRLIRDSRTHKSKNFGYVEFEAKGTVRLAVKKLDQSELKPGHSLRVQVCEKASKLKCFAPDAPKRISAKKAKEIKLKKVTKRSAKWKEIRYTTAGSKKDAGGPGPSGKPKSRQGGNFRAGKPRKVNK